MTQFSKNLTTRESIANAEKDPKAKIQFTEEYKTYLLSEKKRKKSKYTPVARRQDKPDAIAWLTKNHPEVTDAQISKLIGTTKKTIQDIRNKTYWNTNNLRPRDPVLLGICTQTALEAALKSAKDKIEAAAKEKIRQEAKAAKEKADAKEAKDAAKAAKKASAS